jgi:ubiquinone/menaquinone biosynthesis C-methylase UbiE
MKRHEGIHDLVAANIEQLPFPDRSFDLVSANMVVEHLERPLDVLHEILRILKPGGTFVFHTPNYRDPLMQLAAITPQRVRNMVVRFFEGRAEEDIFPAFYRLNTLQKIMEAAQSAGFEGRDLKLVSTSALTMMLGPLAVPELLWIRLTQMNAFAGLRPNIVAVLAKRVTR